MKQLITRWGREVDPGHVREEYPRPMMVRGNWKSLNGWWEYAFTTAESAQTGAAGPEKWDGKILVPFSPESAVSGVGRQLQPSEYLWYKRTFRSSPADLRGGRLLLHFDAVDQECVVYVNGKEVSRHVGGYLPFCADITQAVTDAGAAEPAGQDGQVLQRENTILVRVRDYTDMSCHARGKQKLKRGGMFYTAVSGIWKNVWLEYVPDLYITGVSVIPDIDRKLINLRTDIESQDSELHVSGPVKAILRIYRPEIYMEDPKLRLSAEEPILEQEILTDTDLEIPLPEIKLWNCGEPWLYQFTVTLAKETKKTKETKETKETAPDCVRSYFAMRQFSLETDEKGIPRICLNHKEIFQKGVLDQGYWPESILTPPSDEAIIFDLTEMKKTGFNMVRKHIKIEEERWYFHCDRLGLIVWQDIVNGGGPLHSWYVTYLATALSALRIRAKDTNLRLLAREDEAGRQEFIREVKETVRLLKNHPAICTWVIFNEGWGQFCTNALTQMVREEDPTRLIDQASGWFDQGGGDFCSVHNYFMKLTVRPEAVRASVLSEFGGKAFVIPEHSCQEKLYGYGTMADLQQLGDAYRELEKEVSALIPQGLCASVYTQWTDIEDEVNGVFTYDREIRKIQK